MKKILLNSDFITGVTLVILVVAQVALYEHLFSGR